MVVGRVLRDQVELMVVGRLLRRVRWSYDGCKRVLCDQVELRWLWDAYCVTRCSYDGCRTRIA